MVNNLKYKYNYSGDFLIEREKQKWLDYASIWEKDEKIVYEYQDGNLLKESTISWNASKQEWGTNGYKKIDYSYNSDNLVSESISSLRIISNSVAEYKGTDKHLYMYTTNQVTTTHQQKRLTGDNIWKNYEQQIRKNDNDDNLTEHIYQKWNEELNDWRNYLRLLYFWSDVVVDFTLSLEKNISDKVGINIYPIPAKNNLSIHFSKKMKAPSTLFFYDLNGKEILKKNNTPNKSKSIR